LGDRARAPRGRRRSRDLARDPARRARPRRRLRARPERSDAAAGYCEHARRYGTVGAEARRPAPPPARPQVKYLAVLLLVACSSKANAPKRDDAAVAATRDAASADADTAPWPELAHLPIVEPVRVIALPARPDVPRFTVGGPV